MSSNPWSEGYRVSYSLRVGAASRTAWRWGFWDRSLAHNPAGFLLQWEESTEFYVNQPVGFS